MSGCLATTRNQEPRKNQRKSQAWIPNRNRRERIEWDLEPMDEFPHVRWVGSQDSDRLSTAAATERTLGGGGGESGATSWSSQRTPRRWSREKLKTELSHDLLRAGSGEGKKTVRTRGTGEGKKPDGGRCPVGIESGRAGRVRVLNTYSVPRYHIALLYIYNSAIGYPRY